MAGRPGRWCVAAAAMAVLLGACGSSDDAGSATIPDRGFNPASDPSALRPPGTEIADGVHVQPDSALVGAAFPAVDEARGGPGTPSGWQAVVAVQGDPVAVWDAYAAELGIDDIAGAKDACVVQAPLEDGERDAADDQRFLTEPVIEGEVRLACTARIGDVSASLVSGVVGCVRPRMADDSDGSDDEPCELRSGSALYLRRSPDGPRSSSADPALGTDDLLRARGEATVPDGAILSPELQGTGPSNLPGEGDRIDDGIDPYLGTGGDDDPVAILPTDAQSLIAPAMLIDCSSGLVAVVELPYPPSEAVAAFAGGNPDGASEVVEGKLGATAWATRTFGAVGGYELQLTAVSGEEAGVSYVLATECGD